MKRKTLPDALNRLRCQLVRRRAPAWLCNAVSALYLLVLPPLPP